MSKILYTDLLEYSTDELAQAAYVTNGARTEIDYMEYSSDALAQAAYVSNSGVPSPISQWKMNDNLATTVVIDAIGNTNGTAAQNTDQLDTTGKINNALTFNGSTDKVTADGVISNVDLTTTGDCSMCGWFKRTSASGTSMAGFGVNGSWDNYFIIWFENTYVKVQIRGNGGEYPAVVDTTDYSGTWTHICAVKTGTSIELFVNGASKGTDSGLDANIVVEDFNIGWLNSDIYGYKGDIDDFRVYDFALTEKEIEAIYNGDSGTEDENPTRVIGDTGGALVPYSESTIKTQGSYSLKGVAAITDSLNDTLTRTVDPTIDLTDVNELTFKAYASRTGANFSVAIHDSGGTTTKTVTIIEADTWETQTVDLSGVSNANKDVIDSIIVKILNADAENIFYIDDFGSDLFLQCYSEDTIIQQGTYSLKGVATTGALNDTLTKTLTDYLDYSIMDKLIFQVRSSRTGENLQLQLHDTGGTTSSHTINIAVADTWQTETWDISGITNANKDNIDSIAIKVINADATNTFYFDNLFSKAIIESSHVWIGG